MWLAICRISSRGCGLLVCSRLYLWPLRFVIVSVCGCFGLWPFRFVTVSICGLFGCGHFRVWPLWPVTKQTTFSIMKLWLTTRQGLNFMSMKVCRAICLAKNTCNLRWLTFIDLFWIHRWTKQLIKWSLDDMKSYDRPFVIYCRPTIQLCSMALFHHMANSSCVYIRDLSYTLGPRN